VVRTLIKKLLNKNIQYNLLSLINVFIGFLFILYLGRKFGAGKETDIYFLSVVIITYLGYFIQAVWEAMSPYYVEVKIKNKEKSNKLYSILLNDLILLSFVIIGCYFVVTFLFNIISSEQKEFLNIFIFYLIFQNILFLNKTILNLEHFYASFYFVDIFVYSSLFFVVYNSNNIIYLAYTIILATSLANIWQFYLIFKKVGIRYTFSFFDKDFIDIYKNSFKLKVGSLFYGSKDIIIASVFTSFGTGVYSLFSYANKFAGVILQVVNAPIVNIFTTKATYLVAHKEFDKLQQNIKKVLFQTVSLFIASVTITYFVLAYVLNIVFGNKFSSENIKTIQEIFLVMSLFQLVVVVESPFSRLISIVKNFNYGVFLNIIFAVLLVCGYSVFKIFDLSFYQFLYILILTQFSNLILAYNNYKKFLKVKNEI